MAWKQRSTKLVVLGGGPGGYAAAFLAADLGMQVTLVEENPNPGGVCLYRGCIPSKALLHVAKVIRESEAASRWGVDFQEPSIDVDRMRAWKDDVVQKLTGGLGQLAKRRKVDYVQGRGRFQDSRTLAVERPGKDDGLILGFEHAIIATGSRPTVLPFAPQNPKHIWDSTGALEIKSIPKTLLVIGGGYIGLELGSVYAALGTKVTVVEMMDSILVGVDRDLVRPLERRLKSLLEAIHLGARVESLKEGKTGVRVRYSLGDTAHEETFEKVLVSVGRTPNTENLGLENTTVQIDDQGFIVVDEQRRTGERTLFAVGDVAGQPMLAHKASHEGRTAVEVIHGHNAAFEPAAIPAVVFTDPEIAWTGLTETDAKSQGKDVEIAKFPWTASGRALSLDDTSGVTKLILEPETGRVLGVGVCGPGAGELIAEGTLAIEMGATAEDLKLTIHAHPTLSETMMEAAEVFFGQSTHIYRPKR